jgi:hypothetical protein
LAALGITLGLKAAVIKPHLIKRDSYGPHGRTSL